MWLIKGTHFIRKTSTSNPSFFYSLDIPYFNMFRSQKINNSEHNLNLLVLKALAQANAEIRYEVRERFSHAY